MLSKVTMVFHKHVQESTNRLLIDGRFKKSKTFPHVIDANTTWGVAWRSMSGAASDWSRTGSIVHLAWGTEHAHPGKWAWACGRLLPSSASHKTRPNRKVAYILPLGCGWVHSGATHHTMTIKTEAEKPELTYSKSRGLVALVSGTDHHDWIFLIFYNMVRPLGSFLNDLNIHPSPFLCCSFYETAEDGAERLHSEAGHKLLRLQAVSTIWLILLFHNKWKIGKPTTNSKLFICPVRKLSDLIWLLAQLIHMTTWVHFHCFVIGEKN